jgi:hypothetical protein
MPCQLVNSYWPFRGFLCFHCQGVLDCLTLPKMKTTAVLWSIGDWFPIDMALCPRRYKYLCCFWTTENYLSCIGVLHWHWPWKVLWSLQAIADTHLKACMHPLNIAMAWKPIPVKEGGYQCLLWCKVQGNTSVHQGSHRVNLLWSLLIKSNFMCICKNLVDWTLCAETGLALWVELDCFIGRHICKIA